MAVSKGKKYSFYSFCESVGGREAARFPNQRVPQASSRKEHTAGAPLITSETSHQRISKSSIRPKAV